MRRKLLILLFAFIVVAAGLSASHRPTAAGFKNIPGGWTFLAVYCTNGYSITLNVPAGIPDKFHEVKVVSISPEGGAGTFFSIDGTTAGAFSSTTFFTWAETQPVGQAVSADVQRFEDGAFIAGAVDNDVVSDCVIPLTTDGRLNPDTWQTGAVYCRSNGIEVLYSIDGDPREGLRALFVSKDEIDELGVPQSNTVLDSTNDGYILYRLTNGSYLFVAPGLGGKEYRYAWGGCR